MSVYTIVKFLHVGGAVGYFFALGCLLFGLAALRRALRVEEARALAALINRLTLLFLLSILVILIAGLYMTYTTWGFQTGWINVALVSLLIIAPVAAGTVQARMRVIARLAREAPDGPAPVELLTRAHDPMLWITPQTATALLLGIVFLMTNKPDLLTSLLVMAIALVVGLSPILLVRRRPRASDRPAPADVTQPAKPAT